MGIKLDNLPKFFKGISTAQLLLLLGLEAFEEMVASEGLTTEAALEQAAARYEAAGDKVDVLAGLGHENDPPT